ncbi:type II toxin-antitoxin system PemK/MazF family toxin [bacterium]|nr:type II toxin-antitoxin system PemK/MazF family toxin [bacterium]
MTKNIGKRQQLDKWNLLKYKLDTSTRHTRYFREREVWWCAFGENIGVEINGKSQFFSRPALILKRLNGDAAVVIPLTTKTHKTGNWYVPIWLIDKEVTAVISQVRIVSAKRLYQKLGSISHDNFKKVKDAFRHFYCG